MNPLDQTLPDLLRQVQESELLKHLNALSGERYPGSSDAALARAAGYLESSFRGQGLAVHRDPFPAMGGMHHNIIATLAGQYPDRPPLIMAAHYDTVRGSPGADDNASGLAVLLVSAGILSQVSCPGPIRWVGFGMEEQGLVGSLHMAGRMRESDAKLKGVIVLECVGFASDRQDSQRYPAGIPVPVPSTGNFLGMVANGPAAGLQDGLRRAMKRYAPGLDTVGLIVPGRGEDFPDVRRSDHAAFWEYGYPAVMLTDTANFRNPHYHQPTDTVDTLDLDFLTKVTRGVIAGLVDLVQKEEIPR